MKRVRKIIAMLMALLLLGGILISVSAADDDSVDASFYKLSSVASGYLSTYLAKQATDTSYPSIPDTLESGDAGGFLGYSDNADESGLVEGWIMSALSSSSATFSYDALKNLSLETADGKQSTKGTNAMWYYCQYGRFLSTIGFDSTSAEQSMDIIRPLGGWLMKGAYLAAESVQYLFGVIVQFLDALNPFKLLKPSDSRLTIDGLDYAADGADPALKAAGEALGAVYDTLLDLAPVIIGLLFVILITGILFTNKSFSEARPKIKRFLIRAIAIVIGIPLLGSMYTSMLGWMMPPGTDIGTVTGTTAQTAVLQIFIDFESWAQRNQLSVPLNGARGFDNGAFAATLNGNRMVPTKETLLSLRKNCEAINQQSYYGAASSYVDNILDRYVNGTFYYASSWEGYKKQYLDYSSMSDLIDKTGTDVKTFSENVSTAFSGSGIVGDAKDVWTNGGNLGADESITYKVSFGTAGKLSTMSMYNYLTSRFDNSNVTVFSNEKASSGFVRESHRSVNLIGSGLMSLLFWLNTFTLLICYAMLGFAYCFAMIFNAIKRLLHMCAALPFAMLGSIRSIARVLIYVIMMILEVAITLFVYQILCQLLGALSGLIEAPFIRGMAGAVGGFTDTEISGLGGTILAGQPAAALSVEAVILVSLAIGTILLIIFCVQALKIRKSIVKFVDEMITETIEKLFGVKALGDGAASGPSMGARAAGAVGAGIGAGLAQRAMSGGSENESRDTKGVEVPGGGPGGAGGGQGDSSTDMAVQTASAGDAAIETNNDTAIEAGDVNIDDNDTASASFDGAEDSSANEIRAAESMQSLSESTQQGDDIATAEAQAGDQAIEAASDGQDAATETQDAVADAPAEQLEAAGADSSESVQEQSEAMGQKAEGQSQTGHVAMTGATGQQAAVKPGEAGKPAKAQQDGKPGEHDQKPAIGPDGKPILAQNQQQGAPGQGQSQNQAKPAVAGNQPSASLEQAKARNAEARAKLAAAQAQAGLPAGQQGAAAIPAAGAKAVAGQVGQTPGQIPEGVHGNQLPNQAGTPAQAVMRQDGAQSIGSGSGPQSISSTAPGSTPSAMPEHVEGQQGSIPSSPQTSIPAGQQSVAFAGQESQAQGIPVGPMTTGQPAAMSQQPSQVPVAGASRTVGIGAAPQGVTIPGGQGQPSMEQGRQAPIGAHVSGQIPSMAPGQSQHEIPTGGRQAVQGGQRQVGQPGMPSSAPVGSMPSGSGQVISGGTARPSQAAQIPGSTGRQAMQGQVGQPGAIPAAPVGSPVGQQIPSGTQHSQAQPGQAQPGVGQQARVAQAPVGGQPSGSTVAPKLPSQEQVAKLAAQLGVTVQSGRPSPAQSGRLPSGGGIEAPSAGSKQPGLGSTMGKAAMAAFLASSDNPLVSGVGHGAQIGQSARLFASSHRGTDIQTPPEKTAETIEAYDADTARMEAAIAKLNAQNQAKRAARQTKSLGAPSLPPKSEI